MGIIGRKKVAEALQMTSYGENIVVKGWVRTRRGNKNVSFIALNDGSTINNIQIVVDNANFDENELKKITTGACIGVNGVLVQSMGKGQTVEIQATSIEVYGEADPETYPLQKKGHSMEFLRDIAYLRPRTNTFGAVFRIRHNMAMAIHTFFHQRGFYYFHTPLITASDCEGAGQMFTVTTMDLENLPKNEEGKVDYSQDFYGKHASLTVSGQLEGELGALSLGEIYTFGPTFRAENSNTPRHLSEFWMIEPEMSFYDIIVIDEKAFVLRAMCVPWVDALQNGYVGTRVEIYAVNAVIITAIVYLLAVVAPPFVSGVIVFRRVHLAPAVLCCRPQAHIVAVFIVGDRTLIAAKVKPAVTGT